MHDRPTVRTSRARLPVALIAATCLAASSATAQHAVFVPPSLLADPAALGGQALDLEAGDVNGDGLPDLVAAINGGRLAIVRGLDHMAFAAPTYVTGVGANDGIELADFDEDGHLDVVAGGGGSFVAVLLGNGDGTFGPASNIATPPGASSPTVGDVNGDGHADIVVPCETAHRAAILLGGGGGSFVHFTDAGLTGEAARECALGDMDQDGDLDLVVCNFGGDTVLRFLNNGNGSFGAPVPLATTGGTSSPVLADLNGDGDPELVVSNSTAGMQVFAGLPGAGFGAPLALVEDFGGRSFVVDVDEDGAMDIVASGSGVVNVYRGDGRLGFQPALRSGLVIAPVSFVVADLDLDGDLDAAGGGFLDNTIGVVRGHGDGTFSPYVITGADTRSLAAPDLDGDGLPDIVTADLDTDNLTVLHNRGQGRLAVVQTVTGLDAVSFVEAGDFNGDGLPDIVAASDRGLFVEDFWFLAGLGDGTLAPPVVTNFGLLTSGLDGADFDGDGDLDLAVTGRSFSTNELTASVLFNDGSGSFPTSVSVVPGSFEVQGVAAGDWDLDGDMDLAAGRAGDSNALWLNDGTGHFGAPVPIPGDGGDTRMVAANIDGDADLDLIALGYEGGHVLVCRNDGGSFTVIKDYFNQIVYPADAGVGDVDNDGRPDLVVSANYKHDDDGRLAVMLGNASGNFGAPTLVRTVTHPWAVAVQDFDGDGVADAAFGSQVYLAGVLLSTAGPWADEDHPLAGTLGLPKQIGEGTMVPGEHFRFTLRDARPLTSAFHIVGLSAINAPLKGGVLVPSLDLINPHPVTDAQGDLVIEGPWINAPSGLTLHFQFWLPDPAGIKHFAASNAVSATLP